MCSTCAVSYNHTETSELGSFCFFLLYSLLNVLSVPSSKGEVVIDYLTLLININLGFRREETADEAGMAINVLFSPSICFTCPDNKYLYV